jgi:hypothetical protein
LLGARHPFDRRLSGSTIDKTARHLKRGRQYFLSTQPGDIIITVENVAAFPPPKPTVPVHRVVERIVNQTLDAVEARQTNEPTTARSVIEAAAGSITQHPAQQALLLSLATDQLESMLDSAASERGISLSYKFGSPLRVEATEEDLRYVPPDD